VRLRTEWLKREKVNNHTEKWVERARNKSKPSGQKSGCEKQQQMGRDQRFKLRLESKFKSSNCWNDLVHSLMSKNTLAHSTITEDRKKRMHGQTGRGKITSNPNGKQSETTRG